MHNVQAPCVTVYSDFHNSEIIVKKILDCEDLPEALVLEETTKGYSWQIDTKYYQANVNICPIQDGDKIPEGILELTEGLILYFDSKNMSSFDKVTKWADDTNMNPEILLLVCDTFKDVTSEGVKRSTAMNWCLENGYELIELHGDETEIVEDQDYNIIPEKRGFERIVEALHTHTWSNLDMKDNQHCINSELPVDEEMDEFCELFSQLRGMKESLQSLPPNERKTCAEQLVATFWKAIGGNEDEIDDLVLQEADLQ